MLPVKPGSPTKPVPGYDVRVLDEDNTRRCRRARSARIAIRLPLPPGCLPTLWSNDAGYETSYLSQHPGYYLTGDAGYLDEDGYLFIMSRIDDIINVAGHRLSTGGMEEVLAAHPDVAECAVVGVADELKGEVPVGFVVLKAGVTAQRGRHRPRSSWSACASASGRSPRSRPRWSCKRLPKTRSGKILRGTMKKIADGEEYERAGDDRRPGDPAEIVERAEDRRLSEEGLGSASARGAEESDDLARLGHAPRLATLARRFPRPGSRVVRGAEH